MDQYLEHFGMRFVAYLRTDTRLKLVERHLNNNANISGPQSVVHAAFDASQAILEWIDKLVHAAFGKHLLVDRSTFAEVRFRLGSSPTLPTDLDTLRTHMAQLPALEEQGDGIRAFCGILAAVATTDRPIVLIDEPEAFLHPPQAFLIGRAIAEMRGRGHQLFVSTHSAEVLRGMMSVTSDIQVIRFAQRAGQFTTKVLGTSTLEEIANDPVLSSARVLDGLFYDGVIVTESDGDIVLYRRILEKIDPAGSVHFVNSYSKQLSQRIAQPYVAMGVPCALIVDFDMLRSTDDVSRALNALNGDYGKVSRDLVKLREEIEGLDSAAERLAAVKVLIKELEALADGTGEDESKLASIRARVKEVRDAAVIWGELKRQGRKALSPEALTLFDAVDAEMRRAGLFVVPVGEREAWLEPAVPYTSRKAKWTEAALKLLSDNPIGPSHPLNKFMQGVRSHLG